jgi:hypothetical protein
MRTQTVDGAFQIASDLVDHTLGFNTASSSTGHSTDPWLRVAGILSETL